ncbi:MAG: hypothetical protein M0Q01_09060 [Syntrophales bacterium]|jgi:hypothetical protein|nr:hypothetical protein [Syntrophales bacterium]
MAEKPDKITFKYVHPEDLRDLYANGIYGGVTPRGEIYIHFYSERHPIPKKATHKIDEHGVPKKDGDIEIGGDVVRLVQSSIILNEGTAVSLRDWLNDRLNYLKKLKEGPVNEIKS